MDFAADNAFAPVVADLLRRLRGDLKPGESEIDHSPYLSDKQYRGLFRPDCAAGPDRACARMEVLRAIGNCKTLKGFSFGCAAGGLSADEWDAMLTPLESNSCVEQISAACNIDAVSPYVQRLVSQSRNLRKINLRDVKLKAVAHGESSYITLGAVARGLELSSSRPQLKSLVVGWNPADWVTLARMTAKILQRTPALVELFVDAWENHGTTPFAFKDRSSEEEVQMEMSEALKCCSCLTTLRIRSSGQNHPGRWPIEEILAKCYADVTGSPPLEILKIETADGESLLPLISGNIRHIDLRDFLYFNDSIHNFELWEAFKWRAVGKALLHAPILERLCISARVYEHREPSVQLLQNLAECCATSGHSPLLSIELSFTIDEYDRHLLALLSSTCVKKVDISVRKLSNSFKAIIDEVVSNRGVSEFFVWCIVPDAWSVIFTALGRMTSLKKLNVADSEGTTLSDEDMKVMLNLIQENSSIEEVSVKSTVWAKDGRAALIQEAVQRNMDH